MIYESKFGIGDFVKFQMAEEGTGLIYAVTFYDGSTTYGIKETNKEKSNMYTIPEQYILELL